ncbi:DEAD/DEAH box helicase family protein [Mycoplasma sp. 4423]
MKLIKPQEKVVKQLCREAQGHLKSININDENPQGKTVYFKAPTGSGKTFMMLNFIHQMIKWHNKTLKKDKIIFIVTTLSVAKLPEQLENNFNEYKRYLKGSDILVERIESPSNKKNYSKETNYRFFAANNKVFIIGSSSYSKNTILKEQNAIESLISQIKKEKYKLIYIRDEAHIGSDVDKSKGNGKTEQANLDKFENLMQSNAHFTVKMTATPKDYKNLIELTEKQLMEADIKLLKIHRIFNKGLNDIKDDIDLETILDIACKEFKQIKARYNDAKKEPDLVGINAAMLIQVDNSSNTDLNKKEEFSKNLNKIKEILNKYNLKYVQYFDDDINEKQLRTKDGYSLKDISKNSDNTDVIIFKIGGSTGWNIPRACMLVQLRNISSSTLPIQTIGRIKRNPVPKKKQNLDSEALKYYIYSNVDYEKREAIKLYLKDEYNSEKFVIGQLRNFDIVKQKNQSEYEAKIKEKIDEFNNITIDTFITIKEEIINEYKNKGYIVAQTEKYGNKVINSEIIENKIDMEQYNLLQIDKNSNYLTDAIIKEIDAFYQKVDDFYKNSKNENQNETSNKYKKAVQFFDKTIYWYIFIKKYLNILIEIYKELNKKTVDEGKIEFFFLEDKILPTEIAVFVDKQKSECTNCVKVSENMKYAYTNYDKEINIYLDSYPETVFANEIKNLINYNNDMDDNLKIWTKNPVFEGINIEYYDSELKKGSSYPDFILKYKNHFVYIEVKSENDIDSQKTEDILKSYKKYIENYKTSTNINLTLLIAKIGKDKNISFSGDSTLESVRIILQNQSVKLKQIIKSISENNLVSQENNEQN